MRILSSNTVALSISLLTRGSSNSFRRSSVKNNKHWSSRNRKKKIRREREKKPSNNRKRLSLKLLLPLLLNL
jgi:hypothetical protein